MKLADKAGLKFVKNGIALNIDANGGLKLNNDGELEVRIASNCGLTIMMKVKSLLHMMMSSLE